jgi:hypothetical protein
VGGGVGGTDGATSGVGKGGAKVVSGGGKHGRSGGRADVGGRLGADGRGGVIVIFRADGHLGVNGVLALKTLMSRMTALSAVYRVMAI